MKISKKNGIPESENPFEYVLQNCPDELNYYYIFIVICDIINIFFYNGIFYLLWKIYTNYIPLN